MKTPWTLLLATLTSCLLCCRSPSSNHYILVPSLSGGDPLADHELHVRLSEVLFPAYLDSRSFMIQEADGRIEQDPTERWAEPLVDSFSRSLVVDLRRLLPSAHKSRYPWEDPHASTQLFVTVLQFGYLEGEVVLETQWRIAGPDKDLLRRGTYRVEVGEPHAEDVARAMSEATSKLAYALGVSLLIVE